MSATALATPRAKKHLNLVVENKHQRPFLQVGGERLRVVRPDVFASRVYLYDYLSEGEGAVSQPPILALACPCTSICT